MASKIDPSFSDLYIEDDTGKVLCGTCLDDEFECWPDDWSQVPLAVRGEYACDRCGKN
jgi:hypothetical protein